MTKKTNPGFWTSILAFLRAFFQKIFPFLKKEEGQPLIPPQCSNSQARKLIDKISSNTSPDVLEVLLTNILTILFHESGTQPQSSAACVLALNQLVYDAYFRSNNKAAFHQAIEKAVSNVYANPEVMNALTTNTLDGLNILGSLYNLIAATTSSESVMRAAISQVSVAIAAKYGPGHIQVHSITPVVEVRNIGGVEVLEIGLGGPVPVEEAMAITLKARIYCPKMANFPAQTPKDRASMMIKAIEDADKAGVDIFLASEYFFTHHTASLPSPTKCIAYTDSEAVTARQLLESYSVIYPHMLIIAGSFFMEQGVSSPQIFNTSFVYNNGVKLTECSKYGPAADTQYAKLCNLPFYSAERGVAFTFRGVSCYLQICTDTTNVPSKNYDLSIVPAYNPGAAAISNLTYYKYRILSDGVGRYVYSYKDAAGKPKPTGGVGPIFDVDLKF